MTKYGFEWIQTRSGNDQHRVPEWEHQWLYDREELHRRLRKAGFEKIRDCERLQSLVPDLAGSKHAKSRCSFAKRLSRSR